MKPREQLSQLGERQSRRAGRLVRARELVDRALEPLDAPRDPEQQALPRDFAAMTATLRDLTTAARVDRPCVVSTAASIGADERVERRRQRSPNGARRSTEWMVVRL